MLKFTNIFKNYDKSVLADINIEVEEGEFISILGPSGSGKSTILRLASKLIRPSSGKISYQKNKPPSIGFVFQDATLMPWRNVLDNIILPLQLNGVRRNISRKKAAEWIKKVGLEGKENSFPGELSGGQKMRVSLARSMVTDCDLLLLDEPFAALDEITRRKLEEDLLKIWKREKFTILLVTKFEGFFESFVNLWIFLGIFIGISQLANTVRRLNYLGDSMWLLILVLIPILNLFFVLYLCVASSESEIKSDT